MKESTIQGKICKYLESKGYFFWRSNNTATYDQKLNNGLGGYRSQGQYTQPGLADICVVSDGGFMIFLEVKTPKGRQSADQKLFQKKCERIGCEYYVVRSVDDVKDIDL